MCVGVAVVLSSLPTPDGVADEGWRVLGIFLAVILGFILQPFPMGPTVLLGIGAK